jgi:hypothetical protein
VQIFEIHMTEKVGVHIPREAGTDVECVGIGGVELFVRMLKDKKIEKISDCARTVERGQPTIVET